MFFQIKTHVYGSNEENLMRIAETFLINYSFSEIDGNYSIVYKNVTFFEDYKSALQEAVQTDQKSVSYELVKEEGPAHNRTFTTEVKVDDVSYGVGVAGSKKESEQEAARIALSKLAK